MGAAPPNHHGGVHAALRQGFSQFLRHRRAARHFKRQPLLDGLAASARSRQATPGPTPGTFGKAGTHDPATGAATTDRAAAALAAPAALDQALLGAAEGEPAAALTRLQSQAEGLDSAEAARRLARDGPNDVAHEPPLPAWLHLWRCYLNPFNLLLSALAALSFLSSDAKATVVIAVMVALSTGIRFVQEGRAHRAADSLRALVSNTASVLRRGGPPAGQDLPQRDLVAGDVVRLSVGDMVPADCRVLDAHDLFVAQSAMTGEALPVEKFALGQPEGASAAPAASTGALERRNLVFMGTNVTSGTATALVVATGPRSYFGTLAAHATAVETAPDAFQAGINSVSWLLIRFAGALVPLVFVVNGVTKGDWLEAFLFALSVAVGLTPEMLPMIVTATLAKGAVALARRQVVVKRLDAIQNFGAMDVLCTDKTGTLTQDQIALARHADALGQDSAEVLSAAFLNSHYQTGLKNLLDHAVLARLDVAAELKLEQDWRKVDEIPFDFQRRRMSVVVAALAAGQEDHHELICKGAVEEVLGVCTDVLLPPEGTAVPGQAQAGATSATAIATTAGSSAVPRPLDAALRARSLEFTRTLGAEGLRVVAVARKTLPPGQSVYGVADEAGLTLVGYIGFLDPPKESAAPALKQLAAHGITVKVLTGDNEVVSARVCRQVGLACDPVLLGSQVETLDDAALGAAVLQHSLFAKLAPLHKERIVRALRAQGHVVGFMGDGINDAPALRAADIGISVDTAVDIAKEAADIILLDKSLLVLDEGVVEGRRTFANMLKYIRMTASSNFGNVLSVLVASAFLPFLPMLPLQLLVQNLLYDIAQTGLPFDSVDAELVAGPLQWKPADIGRFMLFFGPVSSLFDLITFAVLWWVFQANTSAQQGLFQSGWFVVGLLTQTLVVHMVRTPLLPFVQSRAATPLLLMTAAIMAIGLWLPMGGLAPYFSLQPLPAAYFGWLAAILVGYCTLTTLMKRLYIRRYGWQ